MAKKTKPNVRNSQLTTKEFDQAQELAQLFFRKYGMKAIWAVLDGLDWRQRSALCDELVQHEETKEDLRFRFESDLKDKYFAVEVENLSQLMKLEEFVSTEIYPNYSDQGRIFA